MRCASQCLLFLRASCTLHWLLQSQRKCSAPAGIARQLPFPQSHRNGHVCCRKACTASQLHNLGSSHPRICPPEQAREKPWTPTLARRRASTVKVNCVRSMLASTRYTLKSKSGPLAEESDSESSQTTGCRQKTCIATRISLR